jgi:hypothetical protein
MPLYQLCLSALSGNRIRTLNSDLHIADDPQFSLQDMSKVLKALARKPLWSCVRQLGGAETEHFSKYPSDKSI